jgi:hypothetical protein
MSLYRVASRRGRLGGLLLPAVVLVVGLLVGFLIGRASSSEPSLADALDAPVAHVADARNALDVLTIEYPQAVSGGEVKEPTEYDAALSDARRAQDALGEADDLGELDPEAYQRATELLTAVADLVAQKAAPAAVALRVRAADRALSELPGVDSGTG